MARAFAPGRWLLGSMLVVIVAACGPTLSYGQEVAFGANRWKTCPSPAPQTFECPRPDLTAPPTEKPGTVAPQVPLQPTIPSEQFAALSGETVALAESAVGYIDPSIPLTQFRLRFDAAYRDNRPDRAEFFYPKCGCFKIAGLDPRAPGPPLAETRVDYQDISSYFEYAPTKTFSGFVEVPVRFLNPEVNANASGIADINAGFKWAFVYERDTVATFQFRTYAPTGDSFKGLGTDHVSLEPSLLIFQKLTDRLNLEGEFRDWIPIGGTDFAGNVLRYGLGLEYWILNSGNIRIAPVAEFVGWTVLGGKEFVNPPGIVQDAAGDTIVNVKLGARFRFGDHNDVYVGYGRALTGDVWYKDILRLEYRLTF
jgi:hypothetical protein